MIILFDMTGNELVKKYCEGVEDLFEENSFKLNVQFSNVQVPCYRTNGTHKIIMLPEAIESITFDEHNLDIEFLTLIALSHETAHYLNEHNKIKEETLDLGIELWADFFGGKILFTLFLNSKFFKERYCFFKSPNELIENYYEGLCKVYEHYYSIVNENYPSKELRIQIGLTASTSVFSYFTNNLYNEYSILAVRTFSKNQNFTMDKYERTEKELETIYPTIIEVHSKIIGEDKFISKNMKEEYLKYITTAYKK